MKLNIGQNIRTLRRAADMTQDELAVKLGVAFQTVSRWENGGTYPDMELLPAIAGVFGVTVDHLLGSYGEEREKQLKDLIKRIKNAVRNRENDTVVALLREVRRDLRQYRGFGQDFREIWNALRWYGAEATPEILEEARLFFAEYQVFFSEAFLQYWAVRTMAAIEDEDQLLSFLAAHASDYDTSPENLLVERYRSREDTEKEEKARELWRYSTLNRLFDTHDKIMNEQNIALLHDLHGITPDPAHPISGDGTVDLWFWSRRWMGHGRAGACLKHGDRETALVVLEDIISMHETLMNMAETAAKSDSPMFELASSSSILPTLRVKAMLSRAPMPDGKTICEVVLRYDEPTLYGCHINPQTELEFWDNVYTYRIGDDPRYAELRERLAALIISPNDK